MLLALRYFVTALLYVFDMFLFFAIGFACGATAAFISAYLIERW